jgi:MFS family permease
MTHTVTQPTLENLPASTVRKERRRVIFSSATIGSLGAVLLVLLRVLQGIAVGGEWGGAALMALEHSDQKSRGFAASFVNAGAPSGAALGLLVMSAFALMPQKQFLAWGWRIPFLASFVLLLLGLFVRAKVSESPYFLEALKRQQEQAATQ